MAQMRVPTNPLTGKPFSTPSVADIAPGPMGMVGGLPDGLNPSAIRMLLKQMGLDSLYEGAKGAGGELMDEAGRVLGGKAGPVAKGLGSAAAGDATTKAVSRYAERPPSQAIIDEIRSLLGKK